MALTIARGVPNITMFKADTPANVITYLVNLGNSLNTFGSAISHIEKYRLVTDIQQRWVERRHELKLKVRD